MSFLEDVIDSCIDIVDKRFNFKLYPQKTDHAWDMLGYVKEMDKKVGGVNLIKAGSNFHQGDYTTCYGLIVCADNVCIGNYAYLRGPLILMDNVSVSGEIKNSILLSGTKAKHRNIYIGDSIIGRNCNIGSGSQFANQRFDKRFIKVQGNCSGLRKLGSIVEHNCNFGVNSSINPGTYIKQGSLWVGDKIR